VKALDTPILLRLLRGDEKVRSLLRSFRGEEMATTEWNLLELELALRADARPGRERRRAALAMLRRRLTVLPLDEGASKASGEVRGDPRSPAELIQFAILATLQSRGCDTWVTTKAAFSPKVRGTVKVHLVG